MKLLTDPVPGHALRARATGRSTRSGRRSRSCPRRFNQDGARIVMAPGPVVMPFLPEGVLRRAHGVVDAEPGALPAVPAGAQRVAHLRTGSSGRDPCPSARRDRETFACRCGVRSSIVRSCFSSRGYAREFNVISRLPGLTQLVPGTISTGVILKGEVGGTRHLAQARPPAGQDAGGRRRHVRHRRQVCEAELPSQGAWGGQEDQSQEGREVTWTVVLKKGRYRFFSDANPKLKGSFTVG